MARAVEELVEMTGLAADQASTLLGAAGGDLSLAVALHFDSQEGGGSSSAHAAAAAASDTSGDAALAAAIAAEGFADGSDLEDEGAPPPPPPPPPPRPAGAPRGGWLVSGWRRLAGLPGMGLLGRVAMGIYRFVYTTGLLQFVASLLMAPLNLLGLVSAPEGQRPASAAAAVAAFESWFEEEHGPTHPRFFRGGAPQALSRSRTDASFVLALLHSRDEPNCRTFYSRILSSAAFRDFADENFVFWLADVATAEGRSVQRSLRVHALPALVVLAHGELAAGVNSGLVHDGHRAMGGGGYGSAAGLHAAAAPTQALGVITGPATLDEEALIAQLGRVKTAYDPLLVAARADRADRDFERLMRQEQEDEYARSLAADEARDAAEQQQREREEEAEREAAAQAAAEAEAGAAAAAEEAQEAAAWERKREARAAKAASLPAEPPPGPDASRVVVKLPDGRRLDRRFEKGAPLQAVVDLIEATDVGIYEFDLVSNFPRKVFGAAQRGESLEALGLHPASTLFCQEAASDDE